jgi:ferredoxin
MKKRILSLISIILFPVTVLFFLFPVFVYVLPFINADLIIIAVRIMLALWAAVFLSSITFLSSYCGFLCPITKLFTLIADKQKSNDILKHRFPKAVGVATQALWIAGTFYVYLRFLGNLFGFLYMERIYSHIEIVALLSFYGIAAILLNTGIGRDELGHYLCPLSPLIKLGIKINQLFKLPGFRIVPDSSLCKSCGQCNRICTYQNDVMAMVKLNEINYKLCSNCGKCVSACKNKAIRRKWTK